MHRRAARRVLHSCHASPGQEKALGLLLKLDSEASDSFSSRRCTRKKSAVSFQHFKDELRR